MDIWREPRRMAESKPVVTIEQVIDAWNLAGDLQSFVRRGVNAEELTVAERLLGRTLPLEFHKLYQAFNGGGFVGNNLVLDALLPTDTGEQLAVATNGDVYRSWDWPIPDELVLFGSNGTGEPYGIWVPTNGTANPIVVQVGSIFEPASLAVVGDDLAGFLAGHSAYYLLLYGSDGDDLESALDALGVPDDLRRGYSAYDSDYSDLLNWANPNLPDKAVDVYTHPWTAEQVAEFAALPD